MKTMNRYSYFKSTVLPLVLIILISQSCTSYVDVDFVGGSSNLYLSKDDPSNLQLVDSLNMNIGESVNLYAIYSSNKKKYSNIPVKWSLINNIGILTMSSESKAHFSAQTLGVGFIEIKDADVTKRISITVSAIPDSSPVTSDLIPFSFDEDTEQIITLSYTDLDSDLATNCSISNLNNITETSTCSCDGGGVCTVGVTGISNYYGVASFKYTVTANSATSNTSTANLNINNVDDSPVVSGISPVSFNEDSESIVSLAYTDADGDVATACSVGSVSEIVITTPCSCLNGTCTVGVTGTSNYYGAASFNYTVTTNSAVSNLASASLMINSVDDAPISLDINPPSFNQDTQEIITLSYNDADGDNATNCSVSNLSYITETQACACSLGVCSVGVTGVGGYSGVASFDFVVTAKSVGSNISTVSLTINSTSALNCPTGFVAVDGNGLLGTKDFCVMKFEAKNNAGTPESVASGTPWVGINATVAQSKCESMTESGFSGTFTLIENSEWMTIARDIENHVSNWSSGSVGIGHIPRGHSDASPSKALEVTNTLDPYNGTGNSSGEAPGSGWEQKRTHTLSNGSVVWDLAGNVLEWTDWDSGNAGFSLGPVDESSGVKQLSVNPTGSLKNDDYKPNNDSYNTSNSFGVWYGGSGGATLRGGLWASNLIAGVFMVNLNFDASTSALDKGFRCVYRP